MTYDSRNDTIEHAVRVRELLMPVIDELDDRSRIHDASKTQPPEKAIFDEYTPKLRHSTYGSDEYKGFLEGMGEGLAHHYAVNRHHPEHFTDGILGMTLVDLIEMLADWRAATERHDDGNLARSMLVNTDRFDISAQLVQILVNTADHFGWWVQPDFEKEPM
jgi:hypothetical protein